MVDISVSIFDRLLTQYNSFSMMVKMIARTSKSVERSGSGSRDSLFNPGDDVDRGTSVHESENVVNFKT